MSSDAPPISRTTWALIACLGFVLAICFGVTINAFGIYALPVIKSLQASNEEVSRAAGAFFLAQSLMMPISGWIFERTRPQWLMAGGVAFSGLCCIMGAQAESIGQYVLWMGACGIGIGLSTYIPAFTLVTHWVAPARQGLVFSVILAAISAGGILFPPALSRLIQAIGWTQALSGTGLFLVLLCAPLLLMMVRMPSISAQKHEQADAASSSIGQALRSSRYWMWVLMLSLIGISTIGLLMSLVPYLVSMGYSESTAADFYALTAVTTLLGNFLFGLLSHRWGARNTLLLGIVLSALGTLLLLAAQQPYWGMAAVFGFCVIWGLSFNAGNLLSPTLLIESVGQRNFGVLLGIGNLISGIAAAAGPSSFGYLVDSTQSYQWPALLCAVAVLVAFAPTFSLPKSKLP